MVGDKHLALAYGPYPRSSMPTLTVYAGAGLVVGARTFLSTVRTDNAPKVRFSATVGEEPEVEVALV